MAFNFRVVLYNNWRLHTAKRLYSTKKEIDPHLLKILVCPLSKEPLRYNKEANELVCDAIGVAYPIINGVPNLVPQDARMLDKSTDKGDKTPDGSP